MSQHPLFDISDDHIAALDDEGLRLCIARLCEADLRVQGLCTAHVLYGGNQIAADGGIDVRVELPADTRISGFIPRPETGFQAKAEDMPPGKIEEEMRPVVKDSAGNKQAILRDSIRELADKQGAYVIVSSKGTTADLRLRQRRQAMRGAIDTLSNRDQLYLDFYDRTRMATWVRSHAGIVLWVRERVGRPLVGWRPFGNWSHAPQGTEVSFLTDDIPRVRNLSQSHGDRLTVAEAINHLRQALSQTTRAVRLTGLSGTGKTRLLEALFDPEVGARPLAPETAIYADIGNESPTPTPLQLVDQLEATQTSAVLILDNCPRAIHDTLSRALQARGGKISLITVDLDISNDDPEHTDCFVLHHASSPLIYSLLARRFPNRTEDVLWRIAEFSGGNARIANLVAESLTPDANLGDLRDEDLFKRLFHQKKDPDAKLLRAAEALALVFSFNGEDLGSDRSELEFLAEVARLSSDELYEYVAELKRRDLVQSRGPWRALLPQPIGNWLAKRALQNRPPAQLVPTFLEKGKRRLIRSFAHRLSYLHDSDDAQTVAAKLLAVDGPLLSRFRVGSPIERVVGHLAAVAPSAALDLFDYILAQFEHSAPGSSPLLQLSSVALTVSKLAYFEEHFDRAAKMLATLVSIQKTNVRFSQGESALRDLFRLAQRGTKARSEARFRVIESLIASDSERKQDIGVLLLGEMLRTREYWTHSRDRIFGSRVLDAGWRPDSPGDRQDWYRTALLIAKRIALSDTRLRRPMRRLIAERLPEFWRADLIDPVEQAVREVAADEQWPEAWLEVRRTLTLNGERMTEEIRSRLNSLVAILRPRTLEEEIRCYVLLPGWELADVMVLEDEDTDEEPYHQVISFVESLGQRAAHQRELLASLLDDLLGPNAQQALSFGKGLGKHTPDRRKLWTTAVARYGQLPGDSRNAGLLGGFLSATAAADRDLANMLLDDALDDPRLASVFPQLHSMIRFDASAVPRLLTFLDSDDATATSFSGFGFIQSLQDLPPGDVVALIRRIGKLPDGLSVAAAMLERYLRSHLPPPAQRPDCLMALGRELLLDSPLGLDVLGRGWSLGKIAAECLAGESAAPTAAELCRRIVQADSDALMHDTTGPELLRVIARLHPRVLFDRIVELASEDPFGDEAMTYRDLRDHDPLRLISADSMLEWAEHDPALRSVCLARATPAFQRIDKSLEWSDVTTRLLELQTHRAKILVALEEQIVVRSGFVPSTKEYEERKALVVRLLDDEDEAVRTVAERICARLDEEIHWQRRSELTEAEGFER